MLEKNQYNLIPCPLLRLNAVSWVKISRTSEIGLIYSDKQTKLCTDLLVWLDPRDVIR